MNDATTVAARREPSSRAAAAVISAVSGPTRTRTRSPSGTSETTGARMWLRAESAASERASVISHGWTTTPTRPTPGSAE